MKPDVFFVTPGAEHLAPAFSAAGLIEGAGVFRKFPDGESYVRLLDDVSGRRVVLVSSLNDPDQRLMSVLLAAGAARANGAREIGLAIPYLPYMRQDIAFHAGEPVSSVHFAEILGQFADWIVTVDPHLHRFSSLGEVFGSIPARPVTAVPAIADWIKSQYIRPLIIGPDSESGQWVHAISEITGAPALVLTKTRTGDRSVRIDMPEIGRFGACQPVIVDDIVSTGTTMVRLVSDLLDKGFKPPVCCCVHALFVEGAHAQLLEAGALQIISCDTVPHPSNRIAIGKLLAEGVLTCLGR
ncbi:MAG: ribose-phosphate diphosphokinase [Hyphomonas sp.]|uniref:ribose-phosphate diphosphokinase n=1 Tax=Hyphomonas sp. TaxID=87 RepID=UPI0017E9DB9D|nr:ribose-phosphate diphosphokinase [Hyphomonas sp.]MBA3067931.1 ribose-phosphate diphosphokinase [Hyphomonas sp.]MBU3920777.1 ribose-phosphate diphosphokinase [Alphaproteobacteria bacterium]MBU4061268.1 ribose-phosphate diphosphokinase [Alphaproteobacteria bacterium]MBU4162521.1 ribose-phosphate diphosphokinase [Alphaproteobacteria bacterium]